VFAGAVALGFVASLRATGHPPRLSLEPREHMRELLQRGDVDHVLAELDAALRMDPGPRQRFDLWLRSGRLLSRMGRRDEALERFRRAIAEDPSRVEPRLLLVAELDDAHRDAEAVVQYHELVALRPDDALLVSRYGESLERTHDLDAAEAAYRRALEISPDLPRAQLGLGRLLLVRGRVGDAVAPLERAAALRPELPEAQALLGRAYLTEGRADDALASYRRALALQPDDPALLNNVAWLLATDPTPAPGSAEEAVRLAERAARTAPDAASHDTLAASLAAAGRFEEAQQAALRAVHEAREQGDEATAVDIAKRLRGYAARRRYVEAASPAASSASGSPR